MRENVRYIHLDRHEQAMIDDEDCTLCEAAGLLLITIIGAASVLVVMIVVLL